MGKWTTPGGLRKRRKSHCGWLWESGKRNCYYCGVKLTPRTISADHIRALSNGGYDKRKNVVAACRTCNKSKGSLSKEAFIAKLASGRLLTLAGA